MDQPTLFVSTAISLVLSGTLLWIARSSERRLDPLSVWAVAMGSGAIALLLTAAAGPAAHGTNETRALLLVSVGIAWTAARAFAGLPVKPILAAAGAAIWLLAVWLPPVDTSEALRLALACTIGSGYTVAILLALSHVERLRGRGPILLMLTLRAVLYLARAVLAATGLDAGHEGSLRVVMLLEAQIHPIAIAFLLLAMTNERTERSRAQTLAEAQRAAEARKRFLGHLSHEIRTPLNGVLGIAQHLRRDATLTPSQQQQVETLEAAGRHLLAIVNDSLDLARIDAGQVELVSRPFGPAVAAEGCLALVRTAAVDKRIALRLSVDAATPPMVAGDNTRLQQILLNVLWNALKFTPEGGSVSLRVSMPGELRFEVSDTGPGIPQSMRERLFEDFSPVDPTSGGAGLGLAISARLATRMGGLLGYHPGPHGVGAMFRLDLPWRSTTRAPTTLFGQVEPAPPANARPAEVPPEAAEAARSKRGLHLLVVDDVKANRFLLHAMLSAEGHRVAEAASGAEALQLATTEAFDAMLLDLRMPDTDGLETARRIRALSDRGAAATPLIAVSADNAPETLRACLSAGMVGLIVKPIEREFLLAELRRLEPHRSRLVPTP